MNHENFKLTLINIIFVNILGDTGVKLLGAPALPCKSSETQGELISTSSIDLFHRWSCADCIKCMVFDTTTANTGKYFWVEREKNVII